jgi:single-stranded DNA-binding protein
MIEGLVSGAIYGSPESRTDKTGNLFTIAKVLAATADSGAVFVNVIAFLPEVCATLNNLADTDSVSLVGSLSPKVWTDKQGQSRASIDMIAHRVMSVYPVEDKSCI